MCRRRQKRARSARGAQKVETWWDSARGSAENHGRRMVCVGVCHCSLPGLLLKRHLALFSDFACPITHRSMADHGIPGITHRFIAKLRLVCPPPAKSSICSGVTPQRGRIIVLNIYRIITTPITATRLGCAAVCLSPCGIVRPTAENASELRFQVQGTKPKNWLRASTGAGGNWLNMLCALL